MFFGQQRRRFDRSTCCLSATRRSTIGGCGFSAATLWRYPGVQTFVPIMRKQGTTSARRHQLCADRRDLLSGVAFNGPLPATQSRGGFDLRDPAQEFGDRRLPIGVIGAVPSSVDPKVIGGRNVDSRRRS